MKKNDRIGEELLFIVNPKDEEFEKVEIYIYKPVYKNSDYVCRVEIFKGLLIVHEVPACTSFHAIDLGIKLIKSILWGYSEGRGSGLFYPNQENSGPDYNQPFEIYNFQE